MAFPESFIRPSLSHPHSKAGSRSCVNRLPMKTSNRDLGRRAEAFLPSGSPPTRPAPVRPVRGAQAQVLGGTERAIFISI